MAKDAKGHGSEGRGGTIDDKSAASALAQGHPKSAAVPVHPDATGVSGGQMDAYLRFARGFKGSGAVKEPGRKDVGKIRVDPAIRRNAAFRRSWKHDT